MTNRHTIYRFLAPAGGFLRIYMEQGRYGIDSDADSCVIEPCERWDSARHQFEHLLAERYGFQWVQGSQAMYLMDPRTGRPLVLEDPGRHGPEGDW